MKRFAGSVLLVFLGIALPAQAGELRKQPDQPLPPGLDLKDVRVFHKHSRPCHEYGKDCPNLHVQQHHIEHAYSCVHFIEDSHGRIHQTRLTAYPLVGENGERYLGEALEDLSAHDREDTATRMVGKSPAFLDTVERLTLAARSDASVLLMGETGTGKELAAEFIHRNSERRDQPFLTVDCTVLTEGLFESEMFGRERGASLLAVSANGRDCLNSPTGIDIPQITEVLNQKAAPGLPEGCAATDQPGDDYAVPAFTLRETRTLRDVEARHIAELLHKHQGSRRRVAGALRISERTLYRKLKRYGLN